MFVRYNLVIFVAYAFIFEAHVEARSVDAAKHIEEEPVVMWEPSEGSREEFFRCRGMPCDKWDRVVAKVKMATALSKGMNPASDLVVDMPGDETEGCYWHSEEQIDAIIGNMGGQDSTGSENKAEETLDLLNLLMGRFGGGGGGGARTKRKVHANLIENDLKWKNPILYKFDGTHSGSQREQIRNAFMHWQSRTCMRFFEVETNAPLNIPHLLVSKEHSGCYSYIGRSFEGAQVINLSAVCLNQFGVAVHEIGHALGFWHEQQRADRDEYVKIVDDNISLYKSQFFKQATKTAVAYDYGSVMHYSSTSGSYTGQKTIVPTMDQQYSFSMGQRVSLSYLDAKAINTEYCSSSCRGSTARPCQRGGYQDPNSCAKCICPDGFGGDYCETSGPHTIVECGGVIRLERGRTQWIKSPGYDDPMHYDDHTECNWLIQAPSNYRVVLSFEGNFGMYCRSGRTCNHYVEVKYSTDLEYPGPKYCCYDTPTPILKSNTSEMVVILRSNVSTEWSTSRRGFKARLTTEILPRHLASGVTPAPAQPPAPATEPPGTTWSDWGRCQNSQCKCGGCSISTRYRLCGGKRCTGTLAASESRTCDRLCNETDTELVYAVTFFERQCPQCCSTKGYYPSGDSCAKSENF